MLLFRKCCGILFADSLMAVRCCWILRLALLTEGSFCPLISRKGGCPMVTYSELIQIGILIVGIIGLVIQAKKK